METTLKRSTGLRDLTIIWFGQLVSILGTGMTNFALAVWAWEMTGSATALSLLILSAIGPAILLGPAAGAIVDRGNRKLVIILADVGAGLSTAAVLLLYITGNLEIWHMYVANLLAGVSQAFQQPACLAYNLFFSQSILPAFFSGPYSRQWSWPEQVKTLGRWASCFQFPASAA